MLSLDFRHCFIGWLSGVDNDRFAPQHLPSFSFYTAPPNTVSIILESRLSPIASIVGTGDGIPKTKTFDPVSSRVFVFPAMEDFGF